jgi:hypothetical protein
MSHVKNERLGARRVARWLPLIFSIGILVGITPQRASADTGDALTVASLKGTWQLSFMGITGCGFTTMVETAVLDGAGVGTVTTAQSHTAGCGDAITTTASLPFTVNHLNPDGSGTGGLSCGPGCGWNLIIQVSENAQMFTAIDVDPVNPGNFVSIVAVKRKNPDAS